jgi:serine/threonine protein kinase
MEFIRGKTLLDYSTERNLHYRERLEIMAKIADAVHHAHQRGLIHRDLKPGNILVDEAGQPKILDFGVARATDSDSQATMQTDIGQLVGTLAYMSPSRLLPIRSNSTLEAMSMHSASFFMSCSPTNALCHQQEAA